MNDPVIPPVEVPPADPVVVPPVVPPVEVAPVVVPPVVPPVEVAPVVPPVVVPPVVPPVEPDYKALYEAATATAQAAAIDSTKSTAISAAVAVPTVRAVDANALGALINRAALTIAADGSVTGVDAEIARLKTAYPGLFNPVGSADGSQVSTGDDTATSPFSRMSQAYAANATK